MHGKLLIREKGSALGPPGPNPLFFGVLFALVLAIAGGATAGSAEVVESNLVYRLIVGGIVFAVVYGLVVVIWLAWHRRTLKKLSIAGTSAEAPGQEMAARDAEIEKFMETATDAIEALEKRDAEGS